MLRSDSPPFSWAKGPTQLIVREQLSKELVLTEGVVLSARQNHNQAPLTGGRGGDIFESTDSPTLTAECAPHTVFPKEEGTKQNESV